MSVLSRLHVDVADLLAVPGSSKRLAFEEHVPGLAIDLARVPDEEPLAFDLRLDSIVEGIHVSGTVSGRVQMECRRCLTHVGRDISIDVDEIFGHSPLDDDEPGYAIRGDEIDLEPMVRDAVVLTLPVNPLCREDCRGLCAVCGEDRNTVDCGHERERTALHWAPLEGLKRRMEG